MLSRADAAHVVIDMQRLFAERTEWHTPAIADILPNVRRLAEAFAGRNYFTKFMVPSHPAAAEGRWRAYYDTWSKLTTDVMDSALMDVVGALAPLVEPERVIEKPTYSFLQVAGVRQQLEDAGIRTLVFSGVETDVCVLASLFDAVDAGFHAVVVSDAVGSSVPVSHDAVLTRILPRIPDQVIIATTAEVLELLHLRS